MIIDGVITDTKPVGEFIQLNICPKIGLKYISAKNFVIGSNVFLFIKEIPPFDAVYEYFLSCSAPLLKMNKKQDICLTLFYDPYFNEFYEAIINNVNNISKNRKNFIIKYLLSYLADPLKYQVISELNTAEKEHYLKYDLFNRSKKLIQLLNQK